MDPNKFGLIRQKDLNLLALPLDNFIVDNLSNFDIEIMPVEFIEGGYYSVGASVVTNPDYKHAAIDISKYDVVCFHMASGTNSAITGFASSLEGGFAGYSLSGSWVEAWAAYPIKATAPDRIYLFLSTRKRDTNNFILGFRRHRSDNVNPKGIIKDVNSDILQPVKADELNGEADRIRNDLSGNAESPDLDSKSGAGADERADS